MRTFPRAVAFVAVVYLAGCGSGKAPTLPLAVVVAGAPGARPPVEKELRERPIDGAVVRLVAPDAVGVLAEEPSVETRFGDVRKKYLAADVDGCLSLLGGDERVERLLGLRDRTNAARLLFWRVACRVAGDQRAAADADASTFATLDLRIPADARDASPEVENIIDRAVQRSANEPAYELAVRVGVPRARVRLDGMEETCIAPCVIKARRGMHVVSASADGAIPISQRVELDAPKKEVAMTLASAPPAVAATQWRRRYEGTSDEQSADSARLLALAVPSRYLVLLSPEQDASRKRLRGLLYFDADVRARAEQVSTSSPAEGTEKVVDELLHQSKLVESPSILKSPLFWTVAIATAAAASVVTYLLLSPPEDRTEVKLR
jgi:hypothetical protein